MIPIKLALLWCSLHIAYGANERRFMRDGCIECKRVTKLTYKETTNNFETLVYDNFLFLLKLYQERHTGKVVSYRASCPKPIQSVLLQEKYLQKPKVEKIHNLSSGHHVRGEQSKQRNLSVDIFALSRKWWDHITIFIQKIFNKNDIEVCLQCSKVTRFVPMVSQASSVLDQFWFLVFGPKLQRNMKAGVCELMIAKSPEMSRVNLSKGGVINQNITSLFVQTREVIFSSTENAFLGGENMPVLPDPSHPKSLKKGSRYMKNWWKFFVLFSRGRCALDEEDKKHTQDEHLISATFKIVPKKNWLTSLYNAVFSRVPSVETRRDVSVSKKINKFWHLWFHNMLQLQCTNPIYHSATETVGIGTSGFMNILQKYDKKHSSYFKQSKHVDQRWYKRFLNFLKLKSDNIYQSPVQGEKCLYETGCGDKSTRRILTMNDNWYKWLLNSFKFQSPCQFRFTIVLQTATGSHNKHPTEVEVDVSVMRIDEHWHKWLLNLFKFQTPYLISPNVDLTFNPSHRKGPLMLDQVSYYAMCNILRLQSQNLNYTKLKSQTDPNDNSSKTISPTKPMVDEVWYRWFSNILLLRINQGLKVCAHVRPKEAKIDSVSDGITSISSITNFPFPERDRSEIPSEINLLRNKWKHRNYGGQVADSFILFVVFATYMLLMLTSLLSGFVHKSDSNEMPYETITSKRDLLQPTITKIELEWVVAICEISPSMEHNMIV